MKTTKKLFLLFATLFTMSIVVFGSCITSSAATYPKKVRIFPQSTYMAATIKLDEIGDTISDIKSSSKNLKVKLTQKNIYKSNNVMEENDFGLTMYAKKTGKYKVSFKIKNSAGTVKESPSITVFVKTDSPVKKATFAGKPIESYGYTSKKSGKVKVTMNKGYKLQKIEIGKYKKSQTEDGISSDLVYSAIKNNATVTLSNQPYEYEYTYGNINDSYYHYNWNKGVTASTYIQITYIDKYTKQSATTTYIINKLLI